MTTARPHRVAPSGGEAQVARARLVVLASGAGTNLQAILDATGDGRVDATVSAVVSNRRDAFALDRARAAGIPAHVITLRNGEARRSHDARLLACVASYRPDWVILAGYMRLLTMDFLGPMSGRVVNLHPALPGDLPGVDAIRRAYAEWQAGTRTHGGVMVHLVPDERVDAGPVLGEARVPLLAGDTLETFAERMHAAERALLVSVVAGLAHAGNASTTEGT